MPEELSRYAHGFAADVLRLVAWLVLLVAIFVPLERLFALHPAFYFIDFMIWMLHF